MQRENTTPSFAYTRNSPVRSREINLCNPGSINTGRLDGRVFLRSDNPDAVRYGAFSGPSQVKMPVHFVLKGTGERFRGTSPGRKSSISARFTVFVTQWANNGTAVDNLEGILTPHSDTALGP